MVRVLMLLGLAGLAGCGPQAPLGPPQGSSLSVTGRRELEPANSLPRGFTTSNPIAPATGVIGTTRVAP